MLLIRRLLAALLVCSALFMAAMSMRENPAVLVFARPVNAGHVLGPGDVTIARLPEGVIPSAAMTPTAGTEVRAGANQNSDAGTDTGNVEGRVVVAAADAGEIVTESRLLGAELTASLVGGDDELGTSAMVPLKLADPDLVPFLHHGDTVNVVTATMEGNGKAGAADNPPGRVVAANARVISTAAADAAGEKTRGTPSTILIALPESAAHNVAAASLNLPLTVAITGERTHLR
ncbi:SAF domain protein [Corynebacterium massiliense DSM 45435]|uniref:SAF domain protein n=2 Tax=Corynebacterium massiliense TaxID=441501 RepID=A0ABY7U9F8_9CORY|nr:SAF domain protein [Corynebacterium massiliense DSM 45435]